ncbi:MAG: hypothetical protein ACRELB_04075, partial [Polyangiaceae bacterium]
MALSHRIERSDALRGAIAGVAAASVRRAAQVLFQAGGRRVLPAGVQAAVRSAVEREASKLLVGSGVLERGARGAGRLFESAPARAVALHGA